MAKFEMDTDFIRNLAAILEEANLGEIELVDGERKIRVARAAVAAPAQFTMAAPMAAAACAGNGRPCNVLRPQHRATSASTPVRSSPRWSARRICRPSRASRVFVNVGDKVTAGQTLLIIEAMKTFNPIKAPKAGVVTQVLVENARPVEFAEVLMIIE